MVINQICISFKTFSLRIRVIGIFKLRHGGGQKVLYFCIKVCPIFFLLPEIKTVVSKMVIATVSRFMVEPCQLV